MTDDFKARVSGIVTAAIIVLGVLIAILIFSAVINNAQTIDKPKCDHESDSLDRFALIRLLPPAEIMSYNAATGELHYKVNTAREIRLGSFIVEDGTAIDKAFQSGSYKGKHFWLLYCDHDKFLYSVSYVDPKQIKRKVK